MYRYLVSACLLLLPLMGKAQVINDADTTIERMITPETSPASQPLRISGIRFGVDLKPWLQGLASSKRNLYNFHLRLDVNSGKTLRYGALLDITHSDTKLVGDDDTYETPFQNTYESKGLATKLGLYLNVIPHDPDRNLVTIGLAYGRSWFDESLSGRVEDDVYGAFPVVREAKGLRAGWVEIFGGMQARIWKNLYAGYNLQLRLFPHFDDTDLVEVYEIPGFGRASEKSSFGFSYFLLYRIPFGKRQANAPALVLPTAE